MIYIKIIFWIRIHFVTGKHFEYGFHARLHSHNKHFEFRTRLSPSASRILYAKDYRIFYVYDEHYYGWKLNLIKFFQQPDFIKISQIE